MWYDISIDDIFFNIKISNALGCDNALNKKSVVYSLSTLNEKDIPNRMTFDTMNRLVTKYKRKTRDVNKEYYFLFVHKGTHEIIIKSMNDISNYVSNPSNVLQINWKREIRDKHIVFDDNIAHATSRLFIPIKRSLSESYASYRTFIEEA